MKSIRGKNFSKYKLGYTEQQFFKWLFCIVITVFIAWYISHDWYQFILLQGKSMEPNYHNLQMLILDKHDHNYKVGDVVAFRCKELSSVLVKRIVAVPGDNVMIINGKLYVNGSECEYYSQNTFQYEGILEQMLFLDNDEYIVIGDNIDQSKDSRYKEVGTVGKANIIGKVIDKW